MAKEFNPLVSIIIPVYNGEKYVAEAVDSALAQTYKNIEIIVVNDGSKDKTDDILAKYGDKIRYYQKENGGVSSALNLAIREMKGEYFSWLSHDDIYASTKIENQIKAIKNNRDELCLCGFKFIDKNSNQIGRKKYSRFKKEGIYSWNYCLSNMLKYGCFSGCCFLIPRKAFDICGNFDENLRYSQDALMWGKILSKHFNIVYNDDPDVLSRIHDGQQTQNGRTTFISDSETFCEKIMPEYCALSTKKDNFIFYFALRSARNGVKLAANKAITIGKENKKINVFHVILIKFMLVYGSIRPSIRRLYYLLFRRVKVK